MEIIYLLIPLSLILVCIIIAVFLWSVRNNQFDDLEGPAHRILMDNDEVVERDESEEPVQGRQPENQVQS